MHSWINRLGQHPIAANGLMILVIVVGIWSLNNINRQFFPDFDFDVITVDVRWPGASAEDIQEAMGVPMENVILTLPEIDSVRTTSSENRLYIRINLKDDVSIPSALQTIEDAVNSVSLPDEVDPPTVRQVVRYESVTDLLVYGDAPLLQLIDTANDLATELTRAGIAQISLTGSPSEQFEIRVSAESLLDLNLSLDQFGTQISRNNTNLPAGVAGDEGVSTQLRAQGQARTVADIEQLPVLIDRDTGAQVLVTDVADVVRKFTDDYRYLTYEDQPAIKLTLRRQIGEDTIKTANIYREWLAENESVLPSGIKIHTYNEQWRFLESRIGLILENGLMGMALVLLVLFIFLNTRIAIWVAIGIPVSFLATFIFMDLASITINAFSLFGFMIAVGIIVDDAIVVSEDTQVLQQTGLTPIQAAISAAQRMWPPVLASSLTTMAAFMPLLMLGGRFGELLLDIPTVVVCAIAASLVECFIILPGHLGHVSAKAVNKSPSRFRRAINQGFDVFRDQWFRPFARKAIEMRWITLSVVTAAFILSISLVTSGRIKLSLPPQVEGTGMSVSVEFTEDTAQTQANQFLFAMAEQLRTIEKQSGFPFIKTLVIQHRSGQGGTGRIDVELISDTDRPYTNQQLVREWRQAISPPAGVEKISFGRSRRGLGNADLTFRIKGDDVDTLKEASVALQNEIRQFQGTSDLTDDLPYGSNQWRFTLTSDAQALGLDLATLAAQMQTLLDGKKIAFVQEQGEEIDLRITLPRSQRQSLAQLESLPIALGNGDWAPVASLLNIEVRRGVESLVRQNGKLSVIVSGSVDDNTANADEIITAIENDILPQLNQQFGVTTSVEGNRLDEREVLSDMAVGVIIALILIFGILAWVFESWWWPLAVLFAIPFGLTGALFGHYVLGLNVSMLSLFGLFGLSGIVVNDSIVLVSFYRRIRAEGMAMYEAVVEAACQRLRPVLLTTITTIAGLTPLLFETSFDAQFLIPMAAVIVFGLMFGTVLILLLVPGLLLTIEQIREKLKLTSNAQANPSI